MYGHWNGPGQNPKVCEFQHGRIMIYVEYDDSSPMPARLAAAQASIDQAIEDVDNAVAFASNISAQSFPDFWKNASSIELRENPLAVFCIRYELGTMLPSYDIWWNPWFKTQEGTAYSEEWIEEVVRVRLPEEDGCISILRREQGKFEVLRQWVDG
ncbi:hypothetical protein EGJ34_09160 [Stenotrophomonas sp. 278]|nr:hypothetical protein EGJ34_09160 [Stenotrophomonas sp. 278]